jgi:deazaflavin-dependent oxidoreductase (nitroreductase family)
MGLDRRPNAFQRSLQQMLSSKPARWLFPRILHLVDRSVYRLTGNRQTLTSLLAGVPVLLLTTRGAKSGALRTVPLVGIQQGENIILIASNFGQQHFPGWYYNLRANPQATISVNDKTEEYSAREITDKMEYDRCWDQATALYKGYNIYKDVAGRRIPIFLLEKMPV